MASNWAYWVGAACLGLFGGFVAGAAIGLALPMQGDPDSHAFAALFWAVGCAPVGAVVSLASAALVRAVMKAPPGSRPVAGQYLAAAAIIMIGPLFVIAALTSIQGHASQSSASTRVGSAAGITTPAPPPRSLGNLTYPGMMVIQSGPGGFTASTPASLSAVEAYFNGQLGGGAVDCTNSGVACEQWTGTMPSGARVTIMAHPQHARDLLMDGDANAPVNTTGPTVIEYQISA